MNLAVKGNTILNVLNFVEIFVFHSSMVLALYTIKLFLNFKGKKPSLFHTVNMDEM